MSDGETRKEDCKRLHAQTLRALQEEDDAEKQVKDMQKKIKKLRRKGKMLSDDAGNQKTIATQALESYAKAACRELCEEIYHVFPREVRDIIYGHLHTKLSVRIDTEPSGWDSYNSYWVSSSEPNWHEPNPWYQNPPVPNHWWKAECTGKYFRRELSEHYYRSVMFQFGSNFALLPRFRFTDQWNTSFVPADIVMNLAMKIMCCDYDFEGLEPNRTSSSNNNNNNNGGGWNNDWVDRKDHWLLLSDLDHLFGFTAGTKINLKVAVGKHKKGTPLEAQEWMFNTVLMFILPTLRRLVSSGLKVQVILQAPHRNLKDIRTNLIFRSSAFTDTHMRAGFEKFKAKRLKEQELKQDAAEKDDDFANVEDEEDEDDGSESSDEDDEEEDEG